MTGQSPAGHQHGNGQADTLRDRYRGSRIVEQHTGTQQCADTADHPNGVWTLPPTNRHDAADAEKYKAIGESDRMTLRFRKR